MRLVGWLTPIAKIWLTVLCCLVFWSLLPLVAGWQPVVVLSGSMAPKIKPGDVVLIDRHLTPRIGQIVLIDQPTVRSRRVLHRVVRQRPDGSWITRGDANLVDDSDPVRPDQVVGVARLLVPAAGRIGLLRYDRDPGDLAWAGATVLACLLVGLRRHTPIDPSADVDPQPDVEPQPDVDPQPQPSEPVTPVGQQHLGPVPVKHLTRRPAKRPPSQRGKHAHRGNRRPVHTASR